MEISSNDVVCGIANEGRKEGRSLRRRRRRCSFVCSFVRSFVCADKPALPPPTTIRWTTTTTTTTTLKLCRQQEAAVGRLKSSVLMRVWRPGLRCNSERMDTVMLESRDVRRCHSQIQCVTGVMSAAVRGQNYQCKLSGATSEKHEHRIGIWTSSYTHIEPSLLTISSPLADLLIHLLVRYAVASALRRRQASIWSGWS